MKIGLIARADSTGLGIQSKEFFDHIPCKALVIDMTAQSDSQIIRPDFNKYPGQRAWRVNKGFKSTNHIPARIIYEFLDGLDLVFAMETAYDYNIFTEAKKRGIKTILQLNYEFLDYPSGLTPPDLFAAPSMWYFDQVPDKKKFLPVPVNKARFHVEKKERTFLHIAGRPAFNDRNGTNLVLEAMQYVKNKITLQLKSQQTLNFRNRNSKVTIEADNGNKANYWENYSGGTLILPRKYGGLCLPFNEALAGGMPIITTNCPPNNQWLPQEWLVSARERGILNCKRKCQMYEVSAKLLAAKIDEFCDSGFYEEQHQKTIMLGDSLSWRKLLPEYHKTFEDVCRNI